jgi:hypothetical protein
VGVEDCSSKSCSLSEEREDCGRRRDEAIEEFVTKGEGRVGCCGEVVDMSGCVTWATWLGNAKGRLGPYEDKEMEMSEEGVCHEGLWCSKRRR